MSASRTRLVVHPAERPLDGSVPVPSDKSIGHRALLFGALCHGTSHIRGFSRGEDNISTANALRAMGVPIDDVGPSEVRVKGVGLFGLREPEAPLDCGNSGTTMRLFAGLLAAQEFRSTLVGDASLTRRPMMRVVGPLRARGAVITGAAHPSREGEVTAPLVVGPLPEGVHLAGLAYDSPVSSAQVKSAILLSGLYAHGPTRVSEPSLSRDHSERMMHALGVPIRAVGTVVELDPAGWNAQMPAFEIEIPGDVSAAAFPLVAAAVVEGSTVRIRDVGTNPTRTGILDIARAMGALVELEPHGERNGEPIADLIVRPGSLVGREIGGEVVPRAIDEIPIVCALAARAHGTTVIRDASELRVKESDRIATMAHVLSAFGVACEERPDGLVIEGTRDKLRAAHVESRGDHRIAMASAVLALLADGPSRIDDCACIATSYPKFVGTLRAMGARIDVEE